MIDVITFLGFLFFLGMSISGFWCLIFLIAIIPFWIIAATVDKFWRDTSSKRKALIEQENILLFWDN